MLAVKPKLIPHVLEEIAAHMQKDQIIFSFAAGVTIASIERVSLSLMISFANEKLRNSLQTICYQEARTFQRGWSLSLWWTVIQHCAIGWL